MNQGGIGNKKNRAANKPSLLPLLGTGASKAFKLGSRGNELKLFSKAEFDARRRIAACLAIAFLLFATSVGVWHRHNSNSPDSEATCQICHIAHHQPLIQAEMGASLSAPVSVRWELHVPAQSILREPIALHASPRAPPAA